MGLNVSNQVNIAKILIYSVRIKLFGSQLSQQLDILLQNNNSIAILLIQYNKSENGNWGFRLEFRNFNRKHFRNSRIHVEPQFMKHKQPEKSINIKYIQNKIEIRKSLV